MFIKVSKMLKGEHNFRLQNIIYVEITTVFRCAIAIIVIQYTVWLNKIQEKAFDRAQNPALERTKMTKSIFILTTSKMLMISQDNIHSVHSEYMHKHMHTLKLDHWYYIKLIENVYIERGDKHTPNVIFNTSIISLYINIVL